MTNLPQADLTIPRIPFLADLREAVIERSTRAPRGLPEKCVTCVTHPPKLQLPRGLPGWRFGV